MIAGSATGALNAPEFIYDRKVMTLQYSRDESRGYMKGKDDRPKRDFSREAEAPKQPKMDWICENVSLIVILNTFPVSNILITYSAKVKISLDDLNAIVVLLQRLKDQLLLLLVLIMICL